MCAHLSPLFWWFNLRVTPLPIPNREVKPYCSDDTDIVGKVACRQNKGLKERFCFSNDTKQKPAFGLVFALAGLCFRLVYYGT
jgi:hypothetical protein